MSELVARRLARLPPGRAQHHREHEEPARRLRDEHRRARSTCSWPPARRSAERVVYTSSTSVYGNPRSIPINEDDRARAALAVRGEQARRRELLPRVLRELRAAGRGRPLLERLRPRAAPGQPVLRRRQQVLRRRCSAGEPLVDPRRRPADPRLHLHRRRGRGDAPGGDPSRAPRARSSTSAPASRRRSTSLARDDRGRRSTARSTSATSTGATSTTSGAAS